MNRTPVDSSNLRSVGYDSATQTLEIEFHSGDTYQYHGVPQQIHEQLMAASSHGRYFAAHIKNVFRFTRMT